MSLETNDFILETSKYIRRRVRKNISSIEERKTQADEIRKKSLAKLKLQTNVLQCFWVHSCICIVSAERMTQNVWSDMG